MTFFSVRQVLEYKKIGGNYTICLRCSPLYKFQVHKVRTNLPLLLQATSNTTTSSTKQPTKLATINLN